MLTTVRARVQTSVVSSARVAAWSCVACVCMASMPSGTAHAQAEPEAVPLLAEPIAYTDVLDAFEELDPLDVNIGLRYVRTERSATLSRELVDAAEQRTRYVDVANHELQRNELALELELGLYRDLMLVFRLPILLGEQQLLRPLSDAEVHTPPSQNRMHPRRRLRSR